MKVIKCIILYLVPVPEPQLVTVPLVKKLRFLRFWFHFRFHNADPDPTFHSDTDPDPTFQFDADPDPNLVPPNPMPQNDPLRLPPTFHFDANPDPAFPYDAVPDPAFHFDAVRI
jgi:hypothetical protein